MQSYHGHLVHVHHASLHEYYTHLYSIVSFSMIYYLLLQIQEVYQIVANAFGKYATLVHQILYVYATFYLH